MAAVFYTYNVSLIHATLFLIIAGVVKWPNKEKAKEYDVIFDNYNATYLQSLPLH